MACPRVAYLVAPQGAKGARAVLWGARARLCAGECQGALGGRMCHGLVTWHISRWGLQEVLSWLSKGGGAAIKRGRLRWGLRRRSWLLTKPSIRRSVCFVLLSVEEVFSCIVCGGLVRWHGWRVRGLVQCLVVGVAVMFVIGPKGPVVAPFVQ